MHFSLLDSVPVSPSPGFPGDKGSCSFPTARRTRRTGLPPRPRAARRPPAAASSRKCVAWRGVARGAFQTLSLGPLCTAKGPGGSFEGAPWRGRRAAPSVSLEGGGWTHVGARPTGRGTCLSASGVHTRRKQLRRTRGALLGPRCPVPSLAVSPLTFPVGKIGTECPRHFQGPPSLPDRTIAGQGPFCPRQASLHHGMLIRLRPQSTPTEQVHTGRLTLHPPRAGRLTLRTHGGRTGPAVWREQVGASRTPLRATCTIPASASRPLRCHERAPGRLPGAGPVCSRPEEHGDGPVCHAGLRPVSPSPSASLRLRILLFNPGLCSLRFKLKYPEQM